VGKALKAFFSVDLLEAISDGLVHLGVGLKRKERVSKPRISLTLNAIKTRTNHFFEQGKVCV
jgi:hypothetical protein